MRKRREISVVVWIATVQPRVRNKKKKKEKRAKAASITRTKNRKEHRATRLGSRFVVGSTPREQGPGVMEQDPAQFCVYDFPGVVLGRWFRISVVV